MLKIRHFRHARSEILVNVLGSLVTLTGSIAVFVFMPANFTGLLAVTQTPLILFFAAFLKALLFSLESFRLSETDLEYAGWLGRKKLRLSEIQGFEHDPASGHLILTAEGTRIRVPRWIRHFEAFLHLLQERAGRSFVPDRNVWVFPVTKTAMTVQSFFLAAVLGFAWLVKDLLLDLGSLALLLSVFAILALLAGFLILRILFLFPLKYVLTEERLTVHYLLRKRELPASEVFRIVDDHYASGGAGFYLIKILFPQKTVILDESFLKTALKPAREWIFRHYSPPDPPAD